MAAWLPGLLKPVAARMMLALRAVHSGQAAPDAPTQSSFQLKDSVWSDAMLQTAGYLRLGSRAVRADLAERLAGALSQARRGSETSAFVAPPELAAQVGCPLAEFPSMLRALGLKPAEKDKGTGAVKLWRFPSQRKHEPRKVEPVVGAEAAPLAGAVELAKRDDGRPARDKRRGNRQGQPRGEPQGKVQGKPQDGRHRSKPQPPARPQPPPSGPFAVLADLIIMQPQRVEAPVQQQRRRRRRGKRPVETSGVSAPKAAS